MSLKKGTISVSFGGRLWRQVQKRRDGQRDQRLPDHTWTRGREPAEFFSTSFL